STSFINKEGKIPETKKEDLENLRKGDEDILNWWVPCRNALFLVIGLAHAESLFLKKKEKYMVYLGIKKEVFAAMKDNTPEFLEAMNHIVKHATHHGFYTLEAPLLSYEKEEIVNLGEQLGVLYLYTYSCYVGAGFQKNTPVHCGKCVACRLRQYAFQWSLIKDPSIYAKE
ncbi:7-cyano-7-deazaguanine synthase, partial [Candidatus Woesearchaeota archaeon]|nr:7-cyano-7-deazaguanine synthase [Candidatus Woesearchaeota archaeon]